MLLEGRLQLLLPLESRLLLLLLLLLLPLESRLLLLLESSTFTSTTVPCDGRTTDTATGVRFSTNRHRRVRGRLPRRRRGLVQIGRQHCQRRGISWVCQSASQRPVGHTWIRSG